MGSVCGNSKKGKENVKSYLEETKQTEEGKIIMTVFKNVANPILKEDIIEQEKIENNTNS